jgi:hypothetical protein
MTALTPEVRGLLAAIRDLDRRTRGDASPASDLPRSLALAYIGGVLGAVLEGRIEPRHATATINDWAQERVAEPRPLTYPELGDDLKRAGEQAARHRAGRS